MTPFLTNLVLFSPLLLLAAAILYLLERGDSLRRGAGLPTPHPPPGEAGPTEAEHEDDVDEEEEPLLPHDEHGQEPLGDDDTEPGLDEDDVGHDSEDGHDPTEGPANAPGNPAAPGPSHRMPRIRNIGTKKARSLALRDRRRAYNEFMHSQTAARAEAEAAARAEADERAFENARARALAEEEITAKRERERAQRLDDERREKAAERRDTDTVKRMLLGSAPGRALQIATVAEKVGRRAEWVEAVARREGCVGWRGDRIGVLTATGWWVDVGPDERAALWGRLQEKGTLLWREMAQAVEEHLVR